MRKECDEEVDASSKGNLQRHDASDMMILWQSYCGNNMSLKLKQNN